MPTQQVITLVLIAVAVVFVIAVYVHNRNRKYTDASLKKACEEFLTDLPDHSLTRKAFLNALKRNYNVGPKEALFLLGHAKKKGFITVDGDRVKLAETI
ncbi:MAG: hypothetical protein PUD15_00460 [Prevotella sp.]|uniref:hypothetical protein n=1 Tax=Prevotella sp. AGR2160 TaxID=1280674 RepID=UPI00041F1917|nr:hypothetical protein [Prevotella sp. AGR2160]MDD5861024.1 hypothetical protein [Prevotella sp.]